MARFFKTATGQLSVTVTAIYYGLLTATPMNARQTLVLNRVLDGMEGKLTNAKWAAIGKCSADSALRDINDLLVRWGAGQAGGRSTGYVLVK